jgi:hypothetical protein
MVERLPPKEHQQVIELNHVVTIIKNKGLMDKLIQEIVKNTPNDQELGTKIRQMYHKILEQKPANNNKTIVTEDTTPNRWTSTNTYMDSMEITWDEAVSGMMSESK